MNVNNQLRAVVTNIKNKRIDLSLSQASVAERLRITQNAYSKIEVGKTKMSIERLYEIAEILNVPAQQLIDISNITQLKCESE